MHKESSCGHVMTIFDDLFGQTPPDTMVGISQSYMDLTWDLLVLFLRQISPECTF